MLTPCVFILVYSTCFEIFKVKLALIYLFNMSLYLQFTPFNNVASYFQYHDKR